MRKGWIQSLWKVLESIVQPVVIPSRFFPLSHTFFLLLFYIQYYFNHKNIVLMMYCICYTCSIYNCLSRVSSEGVKECRGRKNTNRRKGITYFWGKKGLVLKSVCIIWNRHEMMFFFAPLGIRLICSNSFMRDWYRQNEGKRAKEMEEEDEKSTGTFFLLKIFVCVENIDRGVKLVPSFFPSFTLMYTVCMSLVYMSYLIKVSSKVSRENNVHNADECLSNEIWKLWKDSCPSSSSLWRQKSPKRTDFSFLLHFLFFAPWFLLLLF